MRSLADLRKRAEKALATGGDTPAVSTQSLARLVHELQVHQVELEIQNEELREAQARAEEASERYLQLYDSAPVGYFTLGPYGKITQANLTGADLLCVERRQLMGRPFSDFVAPEDQDTFYLHCQRLLRSGGRAACELNLVSADGCTGIVVRMESVAFVPERGSRRHCRAIVVDITQLRRAQDALFRAHHDLERRIGERTRELEAANEQLRQQIDERRALEREVLQVVARERMRVTRELHDGLCQQLFGIRVLTQAARQKAAADTPLLGDLDLIAQCAEDAERGARNISAGLCPVLATGDGLGPALQHLAAESSRLMAIRCTASARGPLASVEDGVIYNLHAIAREAIRNAVRHGKATWVRVSVRGTKSAIALSVHDNGNGLPAHPSGDGLGLRLMRHQADLMGGSVAIASQPGAGTTVTCRIPRRR